MASGMQGCDRDCEARCDGVGHRSASVAGCPQDKSWRLRDAIPHICLNESIKKHRLKNRFSQRTAIAAAPEEFELLTPTFVVCRG